VYLWTLPMFHCNGWCFPWAVMAVSGTHIWLRQADPTLTWRLFTEEGVTHYNAAPTVQTALVNHPDAARLERQVTSLVAGAPPSPMLLADLERLNIRTVHVYGLTETRPADRVRVARQLERTLGGGPLPHAGPPGTSLHDR
jgi:fatty-acyl-CoA synthase